MTEPGQNLNDTTTNDSPPEPPSQFSNGEVVKYKRYLRRSKTVRATCELATEIKQIIQFFLEEYPMLHTSMTPIPENRSTLLDTIRMELPEDALFTNDYFKMPLAPIALLKDIADLYGLPNDLTKRSPSLHLDHEDTNNRPLQLHL